ncbi:MAG: valine--tRNA ligase [archaeon]
MQVGAPKIAGKTWNPEMETSIGQMWLKEGIYQFDDRSRKKIFSIDTPPPYPSGRPWSVGAAAHYSQIDMIARTSRMHGDEVYFPIGIDRNGLPVELYTQRLYKVDIRQTPREKFIELCRHALDDLEAEMIQTMKTMGMSGDFDHYYRTDAEEYRKLTQATFITLWKKGLIYEDTRPNNYCTECGTTIADADVVYLDLPTSLNYIRFKVQETDEPLIIATTRPELLCSCQAVLVHPNDERYKQLHGKHAVVPIYERTVPIIPHPEARPEFGTGSVMICSYGDSSDVRMFRELHLQEIVAVDTDGKMTEASGSYAASSIQDARNHILEDLTQMGLLEKKEMATHRTPTCERSRTPIEIIPMKEFYLKQLDYVPKIRELAKKIKFHPEEHRQILLNWIDSVSIDWPISRRRIYGTEIPIWYCKRCGKAKIPEPGNYYQPWQHPPPFRKCGECGAEDEFEGENRTFDTWFDSSISPLFICGFSKNDRLFKKTFPTSLRPQAKDIIRTWLYYTILRCYQLTGKRAFEHAWIMGYGVDEKGQRMSKSKGNVIDPLPLLKNYGADTFRFWSAAEAGLGSDFRCSEEKIAGTGKFLTKLWNLARFISSFPEPKTAKLCASDRWVLAEADSLVQKCRGGYNGYNFFIVANEIRDFVWNVFAPHYLEMAKARAYNMDGRFSASDQRAAWLTLNRCLRIILLLLAPICPFITDSIWREVYSKSSIHCERFPGRVLERRKRSEELTSILIGFNSSVWKFKKDQKMPLNSQLGTVYTSRKIKAMKADLESMHKIEHLMFGEPPALFVEKSEQIGGTYIAR